MCHYLTHPVISPVIIWIILWFTCNYLAHPVVSCAIIRNTWYYHVSLSDSSCDFSCNYL